MLLMRGYAYGRQCAARGRMQVSGVDVIRKAAAASPQKSQHGTVKAHTLCEASHSAVRRVCRAMPYEKNAAREAAVKRGAVVFSARRHKRMRREGSRQRQRCASHARYASTAQRHDYAGAR